VSVLWIGRYHATSALVFGIKIPGAMCGVIGLAFSISVGAVLNLAAQLSDHLRSRPRS
jgi:hypothetical protein